MRQKAIAAASGRRLSVVRKPAPDLGEGLPYADRLGGPDTAAAWSDLTDYVLDMNLIGAWDLDLSTGAIQRSPQHDRIFGYDPPLAGWTREALMAHVLPEDRDLVAEGLHAALSGRRDRNLEFRVRRSDGEVRWISAVAKRRRSPGEQWHIVGAFQDVTERKSGEAALRQSDERLKKAFISIPDAFSICTFSDGRMLDVNQGFQTVFGYTPGEAIGSTSHELGIWADPDRRSLMVQTLEAEGVVHNFELQARRRDGSVFPAVMSAAMVGTGSEALMVAILKDLSEVRRAERLLRLTQFSVDNGADSVYWTDKTGRLVYASEATSRSLGYPRDELMAMTIFQLDRLLTGKVWSENWETIKAGKALTIEASLRRKDGTFVPVEVKVGYVVFEGDEYGCVFARDITARKEAEKQLEESLARARASEAATIHVLSSVTETRDPYTAGHQRRVAEICVAIADQIGMPPEQRRGLETAALLHDVGKVAVPIEILACPGRLTDVQTRLVEAHVQAGYEILSDMTGPSPVAQIVLQHHERLDGSGYPRGLKGDDILLEAKILAVADTAEAMSSDRPYRPAQGQKAARRELEANRGVLYDEDIVDAYLRVMSEGRSAGGAPAS
jgi:PAS domain S-box-containing protein/putative nucleotidyltransferase with HDIG domain